MSDWIGHTLSKVEVQTLLGRGGMADVYLGLHTTLNRPVAVKILHSHLSENDALLGRFRAEAQAVASLRHPNIVQVFDFDVANERPYIIMELVEGLSLRDYLTHQRTLEQRLPAHTISRLVSGLAAALDYAHGRGIVHRDVKPANVMLRTEGKQIDPNAPLSDDVEPILTDFGVARLADSGIQTASGVIIGTPAYMSPEQVRGEPADSRSDIYSLGIMVYEMLAGVLPFDGDTQASILIKHINEPPPPLPDAPPQLQRVIDRALAKDPARRFQSSSDLARALQDALDIATLSTAAAAASAVDPDSTEVLNIKPAAATALGTPPAAASSEQIAPRRTSPMVWLVGALLVVALIIGVLALNGQFSPASTLPPSTEVAETPGGEATAAQSTATQGVSAAEPTDSDAIPFPVITQGQGEVVFRDIVLVLTLSEVPDPPDGASYIAWLTEPDSTPLSLGPVEVANGQMELTYTDPSGLPLLQQFSGVAISLETTSEEPPSAPNAVVYEGQVPPETVQRLRSLFSVWEDETLQAAIIDGMPMQAEHYNSHLGFTVEAIRGGNLDGAITHSEHVINIVVGQDSEDFSDYNENDRIDNPGDPVGLANYLLLIADSSLDSEIVQQAQTILSLVEDARDHAKRITSADTTSEVEELASEMETFNVAEQIAALVAQLQSLDLAVRVEIHPAQN